LGERTLDGRSKLKLILLEYDLEKSWPGHGPMVSAMMMVLNVQVQKQRRFSGLGEYLENVQGMFCTMEFSWLPH